MAKSIFYFFKLTSSLDVASYTIISGCDFLNSRSLGISQREQKECTVDIRNICGLGSPVTT
jgi:hypothetical protein